MHRVSRQKHILEPYDRRNSDPNKDYGICSEQIHYAYLGKAGAVTWSVMTGKFLPKNAEDVKNWERPIAGALDFHHKNKYCNYITVHKNCMFVRCDCYCDGSALAGLDVLPIWKSGGR